MGTAGEPGGFPSSESDDMTTEGTNRSFMPSASAPSASMSSSSSSSPPSDEDIGMPRAPRRRVAEAMVEDPGWCCC
jgi:hypothetical protein